MWMGIEDEGKGKKDLKIGGIQRKVVKNGWRTKTEMDVNVCGFIAVFCG